MGVRFKFYIYDFMYADTDEMSEEDYFPYTKKFVENYNNTSTPGSVPWHWMGFSYTFSEDYDLDLKFYEIYMERKPEKSPNSQVKTFHEKIVVIREDFSDEN